MNQSHDFSGQANFLAKLIPAAIVLVILLIASKSMVVIVDSGHVGVVRTLGAVQPAGLNEGFHFKKPFVDQVEQIDIRLTYVNAKAQAASKDLQTVTAELSTQYSLNGALAPQIFQRIGGSEKVAAAIVAPAIQESIKSVTAKFTAEELVTQRQTVKMQIQDAVMKFIGWTLDQKDLKGAILLANLAITDFDFSQEFNRAIELKVKAEQEALQAKNEKLKRVTQAEAAAAEKELAATAEAFQIEAQSKARAAAIEREAAALRGNPDLIRLRTVEKWDGTLPKFTGADFTPLINLGEKQP